MGFPIVKTKLKGRICDVNEHDVDLSTKKEITWHGGSGNQYICLKCGRLVQELDQYVLCRVFKSTKKGMKLMQEETIQ